MAEGEGVAGGPDRPGYPGLRCHGGGGGGGGLGAGGQDEAAGSRGGRGRDH